LPYARTFVALTTLSAVGWLGSLIELFLIKRQSPSPLFNFSITVAATLTVVAAQIWVCSFAAAGRTQLADRIAEKQSQIGDRFTDMLLEKLRAGLTTEAARIKMDSYATAYADMAEVVLGEPPSEDGAKTVQ